MRCYVFDLDGTLADLTHRLPYIQGDTKNWRGFFAACGLDRVILPVASLLRHLYDASWEGEYEDRVTHYQIVILSGRSSECEAATIEWLAENYIPYHRILMRKEGDHRSDAVVKPEMLDILLADGLEPIMFFDDRDQVVNMWRARGYTCLQVAPGAF